MIDQCYVCNAFRLVIMEYIEKMTYIVSELQQKNINYFKSLHSVLSKKKKNDNNSFYDFFRFLITESVFWTERITFSLSKEPGEGGGWEAPRCHRPPPTRYSTVQ